MKPRQFVRLALLFSSLAASALPLPGTAADKIKIGFLTAKTGPFAAPGRHMEDGLNYFLQERGFSLAGVPVEVVAADTAGQPGLARAKAQELVEKNKVNVLIGPLATVEALALDGYIRQAKIPLLSSSALADDMTQRKPNPYFIRGSVTASQMSHPLGEYAAKTLRYKRIATIATDFAYGHEVVGGFQRTFEEAGGKIVQKIWVPLSASDFATYIAQIKNVDAIYISFSGSSAQNFLRQYNEYGMKAKIPVLASQSTVDESILQQIGSDAEGVISHGNYSAAINTAQNNKFASRYAQMYTAAPGFYSIGSYTAGLLLEDALKRLNGNFKDPQALVKAMREARLTGTPRGDFEIDEYGNPTCTIYIRKVEKNASGTYVNSVIKEYPHVSQFWTYGAKAFLANPVYSRDFPPARYIEQ
jgi:branched-chain amino acid transport system substrate-binding protein